MTVCISDYRKVVLMDFSHKMDVNCNKVQGVFN